MSQPLRAYTCIKVKIKLLTALWSFIDEDKPQLSSRTMCVSICICETKLGSLVNNNLMRGIFC